MIISSCASYCVGVFILLHVKGAKPIPAAIFAHLSKVRTPMDAPQLSRTIRLLSKD